MTRSRDSRRSPAVVAITPASALALALAVAVAPSVSAQVDSRRVLAHVDARAATYASAALRIWELAEVGYQEVQSSRILQDHLREAGFRVEAGVAGIPTSFIATWGQGQPVIGILAEFDALPGITNEAVPVARPQAGKAAGHACGHHLFGVGSVAAALAVKDAMENGRIPGTIRVYGTPAEEGGSGKVYMVRGGLFDGVDAVLHWHPGDLNAVPAGSSLAVVSAKFRFRGVSSHAAAAPYRGRSALDGVEAMNHMVNLMREHVPPEARLHYVITNGGAAPNVVPDFAEAYYYVRHPRAEVVHELFERVGKAADGAALGTGTTVEREIIAGAYPLLFNAALGRAMHAHLTTVGGVVYDATDQAFAEALRKSLPDTSPALTQARAVQPVDYVSPEMASTDVGDVSWNVPTVGLRAATWVPGTAAHSWQAVAAGGTSIGTRGMIVAAKVLALTALELLTTPSLIVEARKEFESRRGAGFKYEPLIGMRQPPLDYRK